jgi:formylglycine-generating enzyme required for sulfatase activity
MRFKSIILLNGLFAAIAFAEPMLAPCMVKDITYSQSKRTQKVTVNYTIANAVDPLLVCFDVLTNGVSIGRENLKNVTGDISKGASDFYSNGSHTLVWDARSDMPGLLMRNVDIVINAYPTNRLYNVPDIYMIVDVSAGPNAQSYPVRYSFDEEGVKTTEAKTSEIWFKRIGSGKFMMGAPTTEQNYDSALEKLHEVTLTKPMLVGVYEITAMQYYNVMGGTKPETANADKALGSVSWNSIRGESSDFPKIKGVEENSFMGLLCKKTGLDGFDLPTEAQWEYACRAGTTTAWNNGTTNIYTTALTDRDSQLDKLGWYGKSVNATQTPGLKEPNAWGLYDMHGNQLEWTLNYSENDNTYDTVDPEGPLKSTQSDVTLRRARGGSWFHSSYGCRAAYRGYHYQPSVQYVNLGFRTFFTIAE